MSDGCYICLSKVGHTASCPAARERLADSLPKGDHACSTGDCGHEKQADCDSTLARDYPPERPTVDEMLSDLGRRDWPASAVQAYAALEIELVALRDAHAALVDSHMALEEENAELRALSAQFIHVPKLQAELAGARAEARQLDDRCRYWIARALGTKGKG